MPDRADADHAPGSGYAFRHALLREVVYNDLMPGERTRLHARLAALLATRAPGTPGVAAQLAHHSLACHDIPGAFAASIQAGQEAHHLGAPAEAHRHYDQALALWDRVADAEKLAWRNVGNVEPAVGDGGRARRGRPSRGAAVAAAAGRAHR